jgi:hypothetical protein
MLPALFLLGAVLEVPLSKPAPIPEVEAKELLRAVCPVPIVAEKEDFNRGDWGCATCPAYVIRRPCDGRLRASLHAVRSFRFDAARQRAMADEVV